MPRGHGKGDDWCKLAEILTPWNEWYVRMVVELRMESLFGRTIELAGYMLVEVGLHWSN